MKLFIFSTLLIFFTLCNNPSEPPVPQSKILTASVVSGYHKICRKGVTVDSFPITPDDSVYQILHYWDTMVIKSDTLFVKYIDSGVKTYTGYAYKTFNDSISLTPLGTLDSMFAWDTVTSDSQVITLKGSSSEIYTDYAQAIIYFNYPSGNHISTWSTIFNNKELMDYFNSADSASGSFCKLVYK